MRKTLIILSVALALLFLLNFSLAKLSDKKGQETEQPIRPEIEQGKDILPVLSGATPDRGVRSEDLTQPKTVPASQTREPEVQVQVKGSAPASFILVTDVIDGFGGQKQNTACDRYIFTGGQSSAIGPGTSTSFKLYAGFVHSTVIKCGDANADGSLTVADVVYLVNYLFKGGPVAKPYEAGEANCDGKVTISDVVYLVNYLFKGGPAPVC